MIDFSWSKRVKTKNGAEVLLRYPVLSDAPALMNFINPIVDEGAPILINEKQTLESEQGYLDSIIKDMKKDESIHVIAVFDQRIVGKCDVRRQPYKQNHLGLLGISVAKDFRGVGLGKILMEETIMQAKQVLHLEQVFLTCFANNTPALELYKKLGFVENGRMPKAIKQDGEYIDQVQMHKEL